MRLTLIVALGIVLGQGPGPAVADPEPARYVEKAGSYSFVPPKGWKMVGANDELKRLEEMLKQRPAANPAQAEAMRKQLEVLAKMRQMQQGKDDFKECLGSGARGPAPTIVFGYYELNKIVEGVKLKTTLADCAAFCKKPPLNATAEEAATFKVVEEKKLKTDGGVECMVLVTEIDRKAPAGPGLICNRETYYIFEVGQERKLVAKCRALWIDKLDEVFEASLKTFRLEKP